MSKTGFSTHTSVLVTRLSSPAALNDSVGAAAYNRFITTSAAVMALNNE